MAADETRLLPALQTHWGYNAFRPLLREAVEAVLAGRDSVVLLPTGGGKSLSYQLPAAAAQALRSVFLRPDPYRGSLRGQSSRRVIAG